MTRRLSWAAVGLVAACGGGELDAGPRAGAGAPTAGITYPGGSGGDLPAGFPAPLVPADNPMTREKIELGRRLFYDPRLSGNGTQSCSSCHDQRRAFTDGAATSTGSTGESTPRSSMSLANVAYLPTLTWANPLVTSLEQQALVPMFGEVPVELGGAGREQEILARLRAEPVYVALFPLAFPGDADPFSILSVTRAIAAFERTLISGDAPIDRYERGDASALSAAALRGRELFFSERLECFHCHGNFLFSDSATFEGKKIPEIPFHNTGLYNLGGTGAYPAPNRGVYEITGKQFDMGRFRAPSLRNVAVTAPYMHDGSVATLRDALAHYAAGGRTITTGPFAGVGADNPYKSELIFGFTLSDGEADDLIEFLGSLTDLGFLTDPRFADPWKP